MIVNSNFKFSKNHNAQKKLWNSLLKCVTSYGRKGGNKWGWKEGRKERSKERKQGR